MGGRLQGVIELGELIQVEPAAQGVKDEPVGQAGILGKTVGGVTVLLLFQTAVAEGDTTPSAESRVPSALPPPWAGRNTPDVHALA